MPYHCFTVVHFYYAEVDVAIHSTTPLNEVHISENTSTYLTTYKNLYCKIFKMRSYTACICRYKSFCINISVMFSSIVSKNFIKFSLICITTISHNYVILLCSLISVDYTDFTGCMHIIIWNISKYTVIINMYNCKLLQNKPSF